MTRCLRDPTGGNECRAITISTSSNPSCESRNKRPGDNNFASRVTQEWQSFSRPAWYLGKSINKYFCFEKIATIGLLSETLKK